jgi:hypothetical protein
MRPPPVRPISKSRIRVHLRESESESAFLEAECRGLNCTKANDLEQRCQVPLLTSFPENKGVRYRYCMKIKVSGTVIDFLSRWDPPRQHTDDPCRGSGALRCVRRGQPYVANPWQRRTACDRDQSRRSDHAAALAGHQTTVPDTFSHTQTTVPDTFSFA